MISKLISNKRTFIVAVIIGWCVCLFCVLFSGSITVMASKTTSSKPVAKFSDTTALKKAGLKVGQTAKTSYFLAKGDLGGATYKVDTYPSFGHANLSIPLDNGLFANIVINNRSINVASMGIFPNQDIYQTFYDLEIALNGAVDEFRFNNGEYIFTQPLLLGSFSFVGSTSTTLKPDPTFSRHTYRLIRADYRDWGNTPLNIRFEKINFIHEPVADNINTGDEVLLLAIAGCGNCQINNCTFTAKPAAINGCYSPVDLLWFRDVGSSNITITNSKFYNQTVPVNTTTHLKGGCFWYMGNEGETSNSIVVKNCSFFNTTSDESVAIWGGLFKNIEFYKCDFNSDIHQCDGMVGMNGATFEKVAFNNCKFQSNVSTKKHLFFYKVISNQSTSINVSKCSFINNNYSATSVPGDGDINSFISVPFNGTSSWCLNVDGCTFKSLNPSYTIKSIINLYDSKNVTSNFTNTNIIEVNTNDEKISRSYIMGNYY